MGSYIFAFIILICIGVFFSPGVSKPLFYALNIGIGVSLGKEQKAAYENYINSGGEKASYLIPMIVCFAFLGLSVYAAIHTINIPDKFKSFDEDKLYYTENVQSEDVDKLGNYLKDIGVFTKDKYEISVKADKQFDTYIISFVVKKESIDNEKSMEFFKSIGELIAGNVFKNSKIQIQMCDGTFKSLKVIKVN